MIWYCTLFSYLSIESKHHIPFENGRIPAPIFRLELEGNQFRSRHRHKISQLQGEVAWETMIVNANWFWVPESAGNQSELIITTHFRNSQEIREIRPSPVIRV